MKKFSARHPLAYGALLFLGSLAATLPIMLVLQGMTGMGTELASALGRLVVGLALAVAIRTRIAWERSLGGLVLALPVCALVVWNLAYNALGGCPLVGPADLPSAVVMGFAPGLLEELVFRAATTDALRRSGRDDLQALLLSAALFSVVHLTNAVGMDLPSAMVQAGYALSIGLVLGAIYLVSGDVVTVVVAHAAIDVSSQLFASHPTTTSVLVMALFAVLLAAEAAYALWLMRQGRS